MCLENVIMYNSYNIRLLFFFYASPKFYSYYAEPEFFAENYVPINIEQIPNTFLPHYTSIIYI